MSSYPFNATSGPILIDVEITGPSRTSNAKLIFDTGATTTLISSSVARFVGLDPSASIRRVRMATGTAVGLAPIVVATRLGALGRNVFGFPVIVHDLPPSAAVDGLLGLDFLRNSRVTIDFVIGQIESS